MLKTKRFLHVGETFCDILLDAHGLDLAVRVDPEVVTYWSGGLDLEHGRHFVQYQGKTIELFVDCFDVLQELKLVEIVFLQDELRHDCHALFVADHVGLEGNEKLDFLH